MERKGEDGGFLTDDAGTTAGASERHGRSLFFCSSLSRSLEDLISRSLRSPEEDDRLISESMSRSLWFVRKIFKIEWARTKMTGRGRPFRRRQAHSDKLRTRLVHNEAGLKNFFSYCKPNVAPVILIKKKKKQNTMKILFPPCMEILNPSLWWESNIPTHIGILKQEPNEPLGVISNDGHGHLPFPQFCFISFWFVTLLII